MLPFSREQRRIGGSPWSGRSWLAGLPRDLLRTGVSIGKKLTRKCALLTDCLILGCFELAVSHLRGTCLQSASCSDLGYRETWKERRKEMHKTGRLGIEIVFYYYCRV